MFMDQPTYKALNQKKRISNSPKAVQRQDEDEQVIAVFDSGKNLMHKVLNCNQSQ